jgi:hypothetical protein
MRIIAGAALDISLPELPFVLFRVIPSVPWSNPAFNFETAISSEGVGTTDEGLASNSGLSTVISLESLGSHWKEPRCLARSVGVAFWTTENSDDTETTNRVTLIRSTGLVSGEMHFCHQQSDSVSSV